jgi:hypothetical protein
MDLRIGDCTYRLSVAADLGRWVSYASHLETGERFGIECAGATEAEAVDRHHNRLRSQKDKTGPWLAARLPPLPTIRWPSNSGGRLSTRWTQPGAAWTK